MLILGRKIDQSLLILDKESGRVICRVTACGPKSHGEYKIGIDADKERFKIFREENIQEWTGGATDGQEPCES